MIRFFKSTQPASLFLIPVILLLFWFRIFFQAGPVQDANALPLWEALAAFFGVFPSWINFIIVFSLVTWQAIYLNLVVNRHEILYKNSFLPALVFALFVSSTPLLMQFHPVHFINLIIIRIFDRAFTLFKNEVPVSAIFDCGLLAGVAATLFFPAIVLLPFLMATLIILTPFRIKEWIVMLVGFSLPFFFLSVWFFWHLSLADFWQSYADRFGSINYKYAFDLTPPLKALIAGIGILLLFSLIRLRLNYRKNVIRARNYLQVLFFYLLTSLVFLLVTSDVQIIHFAILLIPASIFCSYYFLSGKKKLWIYEYTLYILIAVFVWNHFA